MKTKHYPLCSYSSEPLSPNRVLRHLVFLILALAFTTFSFTAYASENSTSPTVTLTLSPTSTATVSITPREVGPQAVENNATGSLNINGLVYSASALELFWDRQSPPVVNYRVQGTDGTDEILEGTSFFREGLASNTTTQFTVTALSVDGSETVTDSIELTTPVSYTHLTLPTNREV